MIINSKFKGVVKLTSDQYQELKTVGYIVIDGKKYEYDPYSTLYMTDSMVNAVLYTPQELTEEQKLQARINIGAGTSNFSGSYNDLTDKPEVGEPIAEAIRDNTTQIISKSGGLKLGGAFASPYVTSIGIGTSAYGNDAGTIAVGDNAKSISRDAIQFGRGINSTQYSLQIHDDNVYNFSTHTATFQNLQIDGVDEYPTLSGADAPTTTMVGKVKQFYVETTTPSLYYCASITGTGTTEDPYVYNWTQAGGADEELRNNTAQIVPTSGGLKLGGATSATEIRTIAIGDGAQANTPYGVAIGYNARANRTLSGGGGIAISSSYNGAKTSANNAIQLGDGHNSTPDSFQIHNDNIYNFNSHTLTVQNAQVNDINVYGVLQSETDPVETTVGAVGQFYLNTASKALWQCVSITTTTEATTYTWQQVGGSSEKKYLHNLQISGIPHIKYFNIYIDIINNINTNYQTLISIINDLKNIFGSNNIDANGYVNVSNAAYANVFKISISNDDTLIISYTYTVVDSANLKINNIVDTCVRLARPDTGVLKLTSTEFEQCTVIDTVVAL